MKNINVKKEIVLTENKVCDSCFFLILITVLVISITFKLVWLTIHFFEMKLEIENFTSCGINLFLITNSLLLVHILFIKRKCLIIHQDTIKLKYGLLNDIQTFNLKDIKIKSHDLFNLKYVEFYLNKQKIRFYRFMTTKQDFLLLEELTEI